MVTVIFPQWVVSIEIATPEHVVSGQGEHYIEAGLEVVMKFVCRIIISTIVVDVKNRAVSKVAFQTYCCNVTVLNV